MEYVEYVLITMYNQAEQALIVLCSPGTHWLCVIVQFQASREAAAAVRCQT